MYFHVYLIYRFTRTFTDHSSIITRCWGFELQNGKSSLKSPQTLATQDFAPASFLSTPDKKRTTAVILPWFFFIFLHQKYPLAYSSKQAFQIACLGDIKFLKILFDNIFHNSTKCDTINCNINWMIFPVSGIEKVMIV